MKTNSTINKFNITSLIVKIIYFFVFIVISGTVFSQSTNCNAKLEVTNNKFSKKAGQSGTSFRLRLTNTGFETSKFDLKLVNVNSVTKGKLIPKNNSINISGDFYNVSLKKMESAKSNSVKSNSVNKNKILDEKGIEILLKGKQSLDFIVKMKTPLGAKIGSKNKSEVQVTSDKCKNNIISVLLETQIINGE